MRGPFPFCLFVGGRESGLVKGKEGEREDQGSTIKIYCCGSTGCENSAIVHVLTYVVLLAGIVGACTFSVLLFGCRVCGR